MGLAVSIGGVAAPLIGLVGDSFGLKSAMYIMVFFAVLSMVFAFVVPEKRGKV
jgi:FSR family fosmidomycin resistance protein-like MFS transporter